jgi:hypothetical protein
MTKKGTTAQRGVAVWRLALASEITLERDEDPIELRVEVFRFEADRRMFKARIWRLESYRLQSTFPQRRGKPSHPPSDELILKEFEGFESSYSEPHRAQSARSVESAILNELQTWASSLMKARGRSRASLQLSRGRSSKS